jgi:hypothetical protein
MVSLLVVTLLVVPVIEEKQENVERGGKHEAWFCAELRSFVLAHVLINDHSIERGR